MAAQPALLVRDAGPGDHPALADLFAEMQAHYRVPCPDRDAILAGLVARPDGTGILLALRDGQPAGLACYAGIYPGPGLRPGFFLKELYVSAAARGCGIGRLLMRHLARLAIAGGYARIDWTAARDDARLTAFYEDLGGDPQPEKLFFRLSGEALARLAEDGER